jgi:hypothetical protein
MSDRDNDHSSDGQSYEASGLPRGLSIDPSAGVCAVVVCRMLTRHDLPGPDAVIRDGVPLPSPEPQAPADHGGEPDCWVILPSPPGDGVTFTASDLPPGLSFSC